MRLRLLDMLACPRCRGELEITPEKTAQVKLPEGFEPRTCSSRCAYHERGGKLKDCHPCYEFVVEEGRLECRSCAESFEIRNGVPRLTVVEGPKTDVIQSTQRRFAYARKRFDRSEVEDGWVKDSYSYYEHFPEVLEEGRAQVALDVGCGSGADPIRFAAEGLEAVGVDLADTVDEARANTRHLPTANIVQANIYELPFRPGAFDVVYSFGVIHHLPNHILAFKRLLEMVKTGGWVLIYVYEDFSDRTAIEGWALKAVNLLRGATTRLPPALLHGLCVAGVPLVLLGCTLPYQVLKRFQRTRRLAERIPYRHTANPSTLVADLYDRFAPPVEKRFSRAQVRAWFEDEGLGEVKIINHRGWVALGRRVKSNEKIALKG